MWTTALPQGEEVVLQCRRSGHTLPTVSTARGGGKQRRAKVNNPPIAHRLKFQCPVGQTLVARLHFDRSLTVDCFFDTCQKRGGEVGIARENTATAAAPRLFDHRLVGAVGKGRFHLGERCAPPTVAFQHSHRQHFIVQCVQEACGGLARTQTTEVCQPKGIRKQPLGSTQPLQHTHDVGIPSPWLNAVDASPIGGRNCIQTHRLWQPEHLVVLCRPPAR